MVTKCPPCPPEHLLVPVEHPLVSALCVVLEHTVIDIAGHLPPPTNTAVGIEYIPPPLYSLFDNIITLSNLKQLSVEVISGHKPVHRISHLSKVIIRSNWSTK